MSNRKVIFGCYSPKYDTKMKTHNNMIYKHKILLLFALLLAIHVEAQNVSNVRVQQEGQDIAIYYDLDGKADISVRTVNLKYDINSQYLNGDIGKVSEGKDKKIIWHVLKDMNKDKYQTNNLIVEVSAKAPYRTFMLAEGAYSFIPSQYSVGLTIGGVRRFGWYVKARSSFQFAQSDGTIDSNSYYEQLYYTHLPLQYYLTGRTKPMQWLVDIGLVSRLSNRDNAKLYLLTGIGYGARYMMYETIYGQWFSYSPTAHAGFDGDISLMLTIKSFALSIGTNIIFDLNNNNSYAELQLGIGFALN